MFVEQIFAGFSSRPRLRPALIFGRNVRVFVKIATCLWVGEQSARSALCRVDVLAALRNDGESLRAQTVNARNPGERIAYRPETNYVRGGFPFLRRRLLAHLTVQRFVFVLSPNHCLCIRCRFNRLSFSRVDWCSVHDARVIREYFRGTRK